MRHGGERYTVRASVADYLAWLKLHKKTPRDAALKLNAYLVPALGDKALEDLKPEDFDRNLEVERNANALLLEDPVRYAYASSNKKYPRLLTRSMELAQCIVRSAAASPASLPPDLAWTKDFGTEFVNPDKVKQDKEGDTNGPCHHHSAYMSGTGLAYCPQSTSTQGVCTAKPPTTSPNACGGGAFSADQHYQLVKPHSDEDIKALNEQIKAFLSSCKPSLPLVKPPAAPASH